MLARTGVLVLAVAGLAAVLPPGSRAEEAQAATHTNGRQLPSPDGLLGALSFSSSRAPIAVSADQMEFDYRAHVLRYSGNVVVTQADMKLESDALTVALDSGVQNRVKQVVAEGRVHLSQGTRSATAGRAEFDQMRNTVVLSDNAVLHDGPNEVSGDRVVVYLNQERSVVQGGNGRVKALLYPAPAKPTPKGPRP